MARKSRKVNNKVDVPSLKPSLIQTAAYVRLSLEDRNQKGSSIENQQLIISNYIEEHSDFELYDTYIDSGVSGTTFERLGFQRMIKDAEDGKISCIILKDLSRLGRSTIDTGYYAEKLFPSLGIRLISINDNYDSAINTGNITLPLINLVNEFYVIDISRKTRSQKHQAMKDGVFVGGRPPYGYKRSTENKRKLIIDIPAAVTVRQIFSWAADNISIYEIVKRLNASKIPSPGAISSKEPHSTVSGLWSPGTVKKILDNEIYLGQLIQGKTSRINFVRQLTPADKWIHCDNAHEAIVSAELFETVKAVRYKSKESSRNISKTKYTVNICKGKIYCAHCGGFLERKKNHDNYIYQCVANRVGPDSCVGNHIIESDVSLAVLEQLLQYTDSISDDINTPSIEADIFPELKFIEMEVAHTQVLVRSLYENLVNQILDNAEYRELKSGYQGKIDTLQRRESELKQKLIEDKRIRAALRESLRILNELSETKMLTREHVDRFVERIEVFRDGRVYVGVLTF